MFTAKTLKIVAPLVLLLGLVAIPSVAGADATTTITSTSSTATSITLHWTSVDTDPSTPITEYQIYVLPFSSGIVDTYPSTATSGTVTGLTPSTSYQVQLVTITIAPPPTGADFIVNQVGVSTQSASTTTTPTPPPTTIPSSPPTTRPVTTTTRPSSTAPTIRALISAAHTIALTWYAPTNPSQPITKYVISAIAGNKVKRTMSAPVTARRATLTNLAPHTHYTVILAAKLKSGISVEISATATTK